MEATEVLTAHSGRKEVEKKVQREEKEEESEKELEQKKGEEGDKRKEETEIQHQKTKEIFFHEYPFRFVLNWKVGIGGDFWTTGNLLLQYIEHHASFFGPYLNGKRVLELGAGTGLVSLPLVIYEPKEILITDVHDHVKELIVPNINSNYKVYKKKACTMDGQRNMNENENLSHERKELKTPEELNLEQTKSSNLGIDSTETWKEGTLVTGATFDWFHDTLDTVYSFDIEKLQSERTNHLDQTFDVSIPHTVYFPSFNGGLYSEEKEKVFMETCFIEGPKRSFDIVIGTDVVYSPELYLPFIRTLKLTTSKNTLILVGITRSDTNTLFFQLLHEHGFDYVRLQTNDIQIASQKITSFEDTEQSSNEGLPQNENQHHIDNTANEDFSLFSIKRL